ncbi:26S proteasome non-ATPase regulatory subunit 12 [Lepeophtheirus salmonis]|uniref:Proteasome (Prosome, macropain) 26S subunit, nonATPase, 12 [Latimeria chalumnae] n=1 Tax=Lepeophtheirus salmonis TaxID=72036 RepID=A0A0K2TXV3_LEPSM|nr:26S proteasome non-ATPase regulatory subunit 12-like [Lepeophtheirus salmonis]
MSPANKKMDVDVESKINEIIVEGSGIGPKMEVDYAETVNETIPKAEKLVRSEGKLNEALELLSAMEKKTRVGSDSASTGRILVCVVRLCSESKAWDDLNQQILLFSKKRGQLKAAVTKMVRECVSLIMEEKVMPSRSEEYRLINTLRTVTEGKIYVEVERARLTLRFSSMKEEDGDMEEAVKTMRELQVETYGSMERKEKVEFILEQMRLCLAVKDYIRTQIISKKISVRFFEDKSPEIQELKLKFYKYMIDLNQHDGTYLDICRHYRAIYDTPVIQEDQDKKWSMMKYAVLYIILSPYNNEQSDLLNRILKEKVIEETPSYKSLLEQFTRMQLISQKNLCQLYESKLRDPKETDVFDQSEQGKKRWNDLKSRVVEHNIRIMAKYYTRITLKRMSELLDLSEAESEDFLSGMVVNHTVEAKTDRLKGIVDFTRHQEPNDMLNDWSNNISKLMGLVMKATHLINKEEMIHKLVHNEE